MRCAIVNGGLRDQLSIYFYSCMNQPFEVGPLVYLAVRVFSRQYVLLVCGIFDCLVLASLSPKILQFSAHPL